MFLVQIHVYRRIQDRILYANEAWLEANDQSLKEDYNLSSVAN